MIEYNVKMVSNVSRELYEVRERGSLDKEENMKYLEERN